MILAVIIVIIMYYYIIKNIIKLLKQKNKNTNKIIEKKEKDKNYNIDEYKIDYYKKQTNIINNINTYEENKNQTKLDKYKKYYKPRRYITTLNELSFYNVLLEIAKELDLILFAQVSLYSIIETKENLDYSTQTTYFNKINRKSIDFVLVNKENCKIKLCIELDDPTHYKKKRQERDTFINELFQELEIPLLRYPSFTIYYKEPLKKKILENMKDTYYK